MYSIACPQPYGAQGLCGPYSLGLSGCQFLEIMFQFCSSLTTLPPEGWGCCRDALGFVKKTSWALAFLCAWAHLRQATGLRICGFFLEKREGDCHSLETTQWVGRAPQCLIPKGDRWRGSTHMAKCRALHPLEEQVYSAGSKMPPFMP